MKVRDDNLLVYAESLEGGGLKGMSLIRKQNYFNGEEDWSKKVYRGRGLANLMLAISVVLLNELDVKQLNVKSLSPGAEKAWSYYDVEEYSTNLVKELAKKPRVLYIINKAFA